MDDMNTKAQETANGPNPHYNPAGIAPSRAERERTMGANRIHLAGGGCEVPEPVPLRERIERELYRGHDNLRRFNKAQRLAQLIEQYPEVVEMVELLREF